MNEVKYFGKPKKIFGIEYKIKIIILEHLPTGVLQILVILQWHLSGLKILFYYGPNFNLKLTLKIFLTRVAHEFLG